MTDEFGEKGLRFVDADGVKLRIAKSDVNGELIDALFAPKSLEYPTAWKNCLIKKAATLIKDYKKPPEGFSEKAKALFMDKEFLKWLKDFYKNLRTALPAIMSYRWYSQVFDKMKNGKDKITDYEGESSILAKTLPIIDVSKMDDIFWNSFDQVNSVKDSKFSYGTCVIDLDPKNSNMNYKGLPDGMFPMRFMGKTFVNTDEYKTRKLVLNRIEDFSGENFVPDPSAENPSGTDTVVIGSHQTDYKLVTDPRRRQYRDEESIMEGAVDDYAHIVLGNGGSYQKQRIDINLQEVPDGYENTLQGQNDIFCIKTQMTVDGGEGKEQSLDVYKYRKNKHFFIDPFALTIAQWCYIHGKNTKELARDWLASDKSEGGITKYNFQEMERSYWKYLSVWEQDEWETLKQNTFQQSDDGILDVDNQEMHPLLKMDNDNAIEWLVKEQMYDPLKDTRPFYYATYHDVRGTSKVYSKPAGARPKYWDNYIFDSLNCGDEFQMNERTGIQSFMDILNNKVAFNTGTRFYMTDNVDGGRRLNES